MRSSNKVTLKISLMLQLVLHIVTGRYVNNTILSRTLLLNTPENFSSKFRSITPFYSLSFSCKSLLAACYCQFRHIKYHPAVSPRVINVTFGM
jgi:hypothetical protein